MPSAKTVTTNFFWRFFERCGAQLVALVVSIILARLLEPSVYGEIALILVFTSILQCSKSRSTGQRFTNNNDR